MEKFTTTQLQKTNESLKKIHSELAEIYNTLDGESKLLLPLVYRTPEQYSNMLNDLSELRYLLDEEITKRKANEPTPKPLKEPNWEPSPGVKFVFNSQTHVYDLDGKWTLVTEQVRCDQHGEPGECVNFKYSDGRVRTLIRAIDGEWWKVKY